MILDKNTILCDGDPLVAANLKAVPVSFDHAGRFKIPFYFVVTDELSAGVTFALQQGDTATGTFTDIEGSTFALSGDTLEKGSRAPYSILPVAVNKAYVKLKATQTVTGDEVATVTGRVHCALVREFDEPYVAGMYIDKGVTVG